MKIQALVILLSFLSASALYSQNDQAEWLNIGLVMPESYDGLNEAQLDKVSTKVMGILAQNGVSSAGISNGIVMYPKFEIYDESEVSTGMQNLTVVDVTLSLFIKQVDDNAIFASTSRQVRGSGKNRDQALNAAINAIKPNDPKWSEFIGQAKKKMVQYYERMCPRLLAQADQLSKTGKLEEAISMLFNIPKEVNCYEQARSRTIALYQQYINENCNRLILEAKGSLAQNNYAAAMRAVEKIDPNSSCFKEADKLISAAAKEVEDEHLRRWALLKDNYKDILEVEKTRINACRDVAVAYWESRRNQYNYLVIVR